jgi:formylglycine-generating enzyme required for sulfatase activity
MKRWFKITAVLCGALLVTALGIDAADTLSGSGDTLLAQLVGSSSAGVCPKGMTVVSGALTFTCADLYESSASTDCPFPNPQNELESKQNVDTPSCTSVSEKERLPWRMVTREQASLACTRAGKRLPKSNEWYTASVGTPSDREVCLVSGSGVAETGSRAECTSAQGISDAVGNVWEWVSDDVIAGAYNNRQLPQEGYVSQVDEGGVATVTGNSPSVLFYEDYFWSDPEGAYGVLRGGFYASGKDAGVYATHMKTLPTATGDAIGFRCVK